MVIYECVLNTLTLKSHRNVSEEPRIRSQKLHCRPCVYLNALLKKLQNVAEIAYMSSSTIKSLLRDVQLYSLGQNKPHPKGF